MDRARAAGVEIVINPGADMESSRRAVEIAQSVKGVYALVGIHPHEAAVTGTAELKIVDELLSAPRVVGVGEIGLDYYRDISPRHDQMRIFRAQMDLARERDLPVQIHDRDAHHDTMEVVSEYVQHIPSIVLHCFSGSPEMAAELIGLGCYISIAGPVTFSNARKVVDVVRQVPLERLLIETDSPYLTPSPFRGQRNEPAHVREVATKVAEIKGMEIEEVASVTADNAMRIFGISPA